MRRTTDAEDDWRSQLVGEADGAVAAGARFDSASFLNHVLAGAGVADAADEGEAGCGLSPASIFDSFAGGETRHAERRRHSELFELVAAPGGRLAEELREGDLLVRRGEAGLSHVAVVAAPRLWQRGQLPSVGLQPEGLRAGLYAQVVEGGAFPHARADGFTRLVADPGGRVPRDQMILRPRPAAYAADYLPAPDDESAEPDAETVAQACIIPANLFPPLLGQVRRRRRRRQPPQQQPPQVVADPWATNDSVSNILLHPVTPGRPRGGTLTADRSEKISGTPHVTAILGPGATPLGIARRLLPFYTAAQPNNVPTEEELAKAILVYNTQLLPLEGMGNYRDGLCLPVPVEIDAATGDWVLSADHARTLAGVFPAASQPLLNQRPAHLPQPESAALRQEVEAFMRARTIALARAIALRPRVTRNPFEMVFFIFEMFRQSGAGALSDATALMLTLSNQEVDLFSTITAGNALLRRVRMLITVPDIPQSSQALVARTLSIIDPALGFGAGRTRTFRRELPETTQQLAARPRPPRGTPPVPGDPTRGRHRMVLGRDIFAGDVAAEDVGGTQFTGPAFIGRMDPAAFVNANAQLFTQDRADARFQPRLDIVTAIAPNEGKLDAIRQRDAGIISTGVHQWSAHSEPELPSLLSRFKTLNPDEFMLFFELYDLDARRTADGGFTMQRVNPDGSVVDLPVAARLAFFGGTRPARGRVSFTTEWAARVREASVASENYRAAQIREAAGRFDRISREVGNIRVRLARRGRVALPLTQVITSQLGVAFILDAHINLPALVRRDLQRAADAAGRQRDMDRLDREITNHYANIRHTFDTPARNVVIRRAGLSADHGSFNGW